MTDVKCGGISRREVLQLGLAALATGLLEQALAQPKIAQSQVLYQDHPKDEQQCDKCMHFLPPDACKLVDGKIGPNGWCALFTAKPT